MYNLEIENLKQRPIPTIYICALDDETQKEIYHTLCDRLLDDDELDIDEFDIRDAMTSRLCDIYDNANIYSYEVKIWSTNGSIYKRYY